MQKTFNQLKHFLGKLISKIILCCLVLLLGMTLTAYAAVTETPLEQTWYSGQSNSKYFLDFTTEPPTVTCGSPVGQSTGNEGTANFTDPNSGQLKLYTDGISVFNGQTNQVLDNGTGLNGKPSAGEAAMIVPVPGADGDQFYIFTNSIGSVSYSMADLSQGTNGTVTVKNEPLATNTGEALGIVPHSNGTDFWVLVFNTAAKVDAYKVDPSGIASTPVSSNTGYAGNLGRASIIYSPDYNTLALGWAGSRIATAKIDRSTGMISNISQKVTGAVGYATAFSSDGSKLYYALGGQGYSGLPYQIDLNTDVKTKLSTTTAFGGPKLAPDGKIYWTAKNKPALSVVNNPNAVGTAANFALNGLNLKGCYGSWNLPNQTAASLQQINRVPVTDAAIPDQVATEESLFRYPIPADTFSDPDGDELTLSATLSNGDPLPDWLTFDPATNSFSGTPKRPDVGVITLTVTADDGKEGLISTDFKITVNDICHPEEPLNATGAKPCEPSNPCDPNTAIARNTIGFETTPDGATPKDNAALTSSYNDQGTVVTFGFDSNHDLTIDKNAVLESRKDGKGSVVGYTSKGVADIDRTTTKEGGNWLLRAPDGFNVFKNVGTKKQADFLVVYSGTPVQSASGQLWDIDGGEQYKIEALDAKGQVISTILTPG
ncbi:MAG: putative Ig domain-containing protein, partial [Crocosphaera sp.]